MPSEPTRVIVFGPGPKFKGGLANYTVSLAKALDKLEDTEVHIFSWSQQYPAIIPRDFIDRSSKADLLEGTNVQIRYVTNYNNPFSWQRTYKEMIALKPDKIIFQWSIAIQGLPLGYITRKLSKHKDIEVLFDLHFVIQKEKSTIDTRFTKYGISKADTYITHAYKTATELKEIFPKTSFEINETGVRAGDNKKTIIKLYHPVYDMFQPDPVFDKEQQKKQLNLKTNVFLFFGFIRKYKGLHHVIRAFAEVAKVRNDVSLLIVGESFWKTLDTSKFSTKLKTALFKVLNKIMVKKGDSEIDYNPLALIDELGLQDNVRVFNDYVPNEDVHKYFQVSNCIMLYYEYATPSGVESIGYNFKVPMLATNVGHFPETVKDGFNGYLAEPNDIRSMADTMLKFLEHPIPVENVAATAKEMNWKNYAEKAIGR
ncbi:MAG: glycosyltransferase [Bacteroidetes bacterium]|nr:glycosyltransferase [Bacteroidota bacterium]